MKYFKLSLLAFVATVILYILISFGASEAKSCCEGGRCTGSAYCSACSNCSRCAHCGAGGTCGVCSYRSKPGKSGVIIEQPKSKTMVNKKSDTTPNDPDNLKGTYIVTASVNLRDAPRIDADIIAVLRAGTKISVTGFVNNEWAKTEVSINPAEETPQKVAGYISMKFILKVKGE
jgi:hypothetical protein